MKHKDTTKGKLMILLLILILTGIAAGFIWSSALRMRSQRIERTNSYYRR